MILSEIKICRWINIEDNRYFFEGFAEAEVSFDDPSYTDEFGLVKLPTQIHIENIRITECVIHDEEDNELLDSEYFDKLQVLEESLIDDDSILEQIYEELNQRYRERVPCVSS